MRVRLLLVVLMAVAAIAALFLTGVLDPGMLGIGGRRAAPEADAPDEATAGAEEKAGLAAAAGGVRKKHGGATEDGPESAVEAPMPSEVVGTAPLGASLRGRVVRTEAKIPVEGATVRLTRPDSLFHYLRAKREGRYDDLTARTDAAGKFVFKNVAPATGYAVVAREGSSAAVTKKDIALAARQPKEIEDLVLGPAGGLGGRVADGAGQALPGVRVAITWQVRNDFGVILADPDTLPWIEAETKTDAEGRWSSKALEPGDKTIVFKSAKGVSDVKSPITVTANEQRDDVDMVLGGTMAFAGKVMWKGGGPIEGARVFAKASRNPAAFTVDTGADGAFRIEGLAEGKYGMGVVVPGIPVKIDQAERSAGAEDLLFEFEPTGSLSGTVVSKATHKPVQRYRLDAKFTGPLDGTEQYITRELAKVVGPAVFQSPSGAFKFERLREGPYQMIVEAEGFPRTVIEKKVEVAVGAETTGVVLELADGNSASGIVVDSAGPVAGASVFVMAAPKTASASESVSEEEEFVDEEDFGAGDAVATSEADGRFDTGPLTPRAYRILVRVEGRLPAIVNGVDLIHGSKADLKLTIPRGGGVRVVVLDHRGRPATGVSVVAFSASHAEPDLATSGADGAAELKPLAEGKWVVAWNGAAIQDILQGHVDMQTRERVGAVADPKERYERVRHIGGEEVDVADGRTPAITVRLPRLATVRCVVSVGGRPYAEKGVWLLSASDHWANARTDKQGRFTLEHAEPGTSQLYMNVGAEGERQQWEASPVTVPDAEEATIEVSR